uniref:Uncharacterized protein n=1 Tax=Sarcophilus harrisii TaxID=9305 RepID=A0A7N4PB95_SARHA
MAPAGFTVAAASFALFRGLHRGLRLAPAPRLADPQDRWMWRNICASLVHSLLSGAGALLWMSQYSHLVSDFARGCPPGTAALVSLSVGEWGSRRRGRSAGGPRGAPLPAPGFPALSPSPRPRRLLPGRCGGSPVESALGPIVAPALSPRAGSGLPECGCDAGKLPEHLRGASAVGGELGLPALAEAASAGRPAVLPALLPGQLGHAGHPAGLPPAALGMDQPAAAPAPPPLPPPLHCALGSRAARHHHHEHEVTHRPAHQWPLGPSLAHKEGDQKHRGTGEGGLRQASTQRGHLLQAAGLAQTCDLGDRRLRSGRSTGFNPLGPRCTRCRGFLSPGVRGAEAGLGPMLLGGEPRCWC